MKRALHFVLLTLVVLSTIEASAASKKQSKPPTKQQTSAVRVYKTEPGAAIALVPRPKRERSRMGNKALSDDDLVAAPGPVSAGPPTEGSMRRAGSPQLDLRFLPQEPPIRQERPEREAPNVTPVPVQGQIVPPNRNTAAPAPLSAPSPSPSASFLGLDFANWGAGRPPDTVGDVGPNHYIQAVNTSIGVYSKTGGAPLAAFTFNTLMSQGHFGNLCDTNNFGDPIILYDTFEDRWVITDFAFQLDGGQNVVSPPGAFQCFAVSKTGDPISGGWNFYSLHITDLLNDYPKLGIWPDGIYMSANMFGFPATGTYQGTRVWALNKAQMYAGAPAIQVVQFNPPSSEFTLLPSNARLQAGTPPAGSPNYFSTVGNFTNAISTYKFHVDWTRISLSTFDGPFVTIAPASWITAPSTVPAKSGNNNDSLATRPMMQNQYTNLGGVESLWLTHTVRNPSTSGVASVRYYQTNVNGGAIAANTVQAATHAPDAINRYMPSLAVDRAGNMALGYSASSLTLFPAIRYAGRLAADPLNTLPQTETSLIEGTGSQNSSTRWGDYSAMSLDPDGCTFWFTSEYYATIGSNWQTRIGSFNYGPASCTPVATGTVSGTVTAAAGGAPIAGAIVSFGSRTTATNGSGGYSFALVPSGTYGGITVTAPGYNPGTSATIVVTDGNTTTQDFSLSAAPASGCPTDTNQADFQTGVATNTDLTATPGAVVLLNTPVLDQQNTSLSNSGSGVDTVNWGGQTFTAGLTGPLSRADVNIFCFTCTGTAPNLTLSLRAVSGNLPAGPDLATATLPGTNSGASGYLTATFATPATVTAGTSYALVVRPVANPSAGTYALTFSSGSAYANGQSVSSTDGGGTWTGATNDLGFKTYVKTGFTTSGDFVSGLKDANPASGFTPVWSTISWTATVPANTSLKFQVAASNSSNGPFTFVGPDGTAATFFTTSGASLSQFYGFRYLKYKAYLATTDTTQTPVLNDVAVCYSVIDCSAPITITPTPSQVCGNSTGNTASGPAGAVSYAWSIVNGTITGSTTSQSVTYTAGASGSVGLTLNIVDAGACHKSASANVPISATPSTPAVTPSGPTTFCTGGSVTLTSSSATGNQWYNGATLLAGQTNQTFIATATGNYNVVVTASGCSSVASASTAVTVNSIPATPTVTPGGATTFCAGGSVTLTSSSATGNQWYNGATLLAGQTNQTYAATTTGNYNVVVTSSGCSSAPSASTAVTVNSTPTPAVTPGGPTTFCTGGSVTLTSNSATGNQWYNGATLLAGQTNQTYIATTTGNYNVIVTANGCPSAASAATAVTVNAIPPTPVVTPGGATTFCAGGSVTLTSSSASGNQWYDGATLLAGQTSQTYVATTSGNYRVVVTASGCSSASSSSTAVTVNPLPATPAITPGGATTFCNGGSVTLTSSSTIGNQWYLNGNPIGGATSQAYIATASGNYTVKVTDGNACTSAASAVTTVTVNAIPATPTITPSGSVQFCSAGSKTLTSSSATGNQWYLEGTAISGATNQTVSADNPGHYTVVVTTNGCSSASSAATNVTINPTPAKPVITPGGPTTFCAGGSVTLSSNSPSGNQWSLNGNPIIGGTNQTFVASAAGSYTVTVTTSGCVSSASDPLVVTVNPLPATPAITPGGPTTFCAGGSVNLTSSSASGNQWLLNGNPIGGATNQLYSATASGSYTVKVTGANTCTSPASSATVVTVNPIPATPSITPGGPTTFCAGGSVVLTSSSASGNQWFLNGNAIGGATSQAYSATASGSYTVTVTTAGCTSAVSTATTVTVNPKPNVTITAPVNVITNSAGNNASVASAGAGATYVWGITGGTITAGSGTNSITFTAGGAGTLTLNVTVTTSAGCSDAKSVNVNVVLPPVTVTSVTPGLGITAGGSPITINGSGFVTGATVVIGGAAATNVTVVSPIKITAKTPAHAAGTVNVTVTNADTSAGTLTSGFRYQATVFDPNADGVIDPADIFFMINYLFTGGQAPHGEAGLLSGDANSDSVIDPADIFFTINYLFLGGSSSALPQPRAMAIGTEAPTIAGSISLGTPVLRGGHYFVPVIMAARPGSIVPQTMSLKLHFEAEGAVGEVAVRRAGVAKDLNTVFEFSRRTGDDLSHLVSYDPRGLVLGASRSAVVAEIEIDSVEAAISISIDPRLTMLGDRTGAMKATAGNGKLELSGTTIGPARPPRPRSPRVEMN